jgi:NMD protein affecting ribosome stability and mRNA decay
MKERSLARSERGLVRALDHRGVRTDKSPPVSAERTYRDPTVCDACGAVYSRKTWRASLAREGNALRRGAARATCPACLQVGEGKGFGRVLVSGTWLAEHEDELRRRVANVAARARHTQPERRVVAIRRRGGGLEITTTSQKLAHRVVRELQKAFGGQVAYAWSDRDGALRATWTRD